MATAIVCGGRDFSDSKHLFQCLDLCRKWWNLDKIVHGGAKGADTLAHEWANSRKLVVVRSPADWNTYGKSAGMIRNRSMLDYAPQVVIAFKGGTGTENMITISRQAEIPVFIL